MQTWLLAATTNMAVNLAMYDQDLHVD